MITFEEASEFLLAKQKEINGKLEEMLSNVGLLDDEHDIIYELDELRKSLSRIIEYIDNLDLYEVETMEARIRSEPDPDREWDDQI